MDEPGKYATAKLAWETFENDILPRLLAMDTSFLFYQNGALLSANHAFLKRFNYSPSDPAEIHEALWRGSEDRTRFHQDVAACLSGKKVESREYLMFHGDGAEARAKIHFVPFGFTDHEPICACAISDQAATAHIMQLMQDFGDDIFQLIAEQSLNGIALIDDRFRLIYMNPAGLAIYGFKDLEEAKNTPIINTIAPEHMPLLIERARNWLKSVPSDPHFVTKIVRRDGEIRDQEIMAASLYRNGQLCRLNTFIDITDRLAAEQALRESEERSRAQYKGFPVPTYTWRRQGDDFVLEEYNDAADAITSGHMNEFLGMKASQMYADRPEILADLKRGFDERTTINGEYDYHYRTTGQTRRIAAKVAPVSADLVLVHTEDVTDRRKAEEALQRSEERFRIAAQCASDLIYEYDVKTGQLNWFGDVDALFGFGPGEFPPLLDDYNLLIHPEDRERVFAAVRETLLAGKPYYQEYRIRKKGGEFLEVASRGTMVLDEQGRLERWIGAVTDITLHKQAEQAIRQSEEKYRLLFDSSPESIAIIGLDGTILDVNQAGVDFVALTRDEIAGENLNTFSPFHQEDIPGFANIFSRLLQGEQISPVQLRVKKGQQDIWVESFPSLLKRDGRAYAIQVITRDITQARKAMEALRQSEESFRAAATIASDLIFEWNWDTRRFEWYGDVDAMFGYPPGEFPRDLFEGNKLIHRDDRKRYLEAVARTVSRGAPFNEEYRVRRKDGSYVFVSSRGMGIPEKGGNLFRWIGVNTDITERKKAEQALLESERKYRLHAENVTDVIWTIDRDSRMTYISPSIASLTGYSPEELIGASPDKLMSPELSEAARQAFKRAVENGRAEAHEHGGQAFTVEMQFLRKDGSPVWTEIKWSFLRDEQGRSTGMLGVARDIEKRKQAELVLEQTERRLRLALKEELRHARTKDHLEFRGADADFHQYPSPAMRQMLEEARVAAQSDGNLLLLGKSGAGKNFLAGWIHQQSPRADGPFLTINCSAIPASLIESELFGHEAGAFTGSRGTKRGLLELAEGGTLFLDEIGDMDLMLQTRLLQFLDTRAIRRVGGSKSITVDSRIIAATNHDLEGLVREGSFREDLYYRLNVLAIRVPSLHERREDLPVLAGEIIRRLARDMGLNKPPVLGPEVLKAITRYDWPGNVRELKNILERMLLTAEDKLIINDSSLIITQTNRIPREPQHLDLQKARMDPTEPNQTEGKGSSLKSAQTDVIKKLIQEALARAQTRKEAAEILGISRHALYRYMSKLGIKARKTLIVRDK